ncbi:MAG: O-antigen ligase family protein [Planctomycetota bacterium]
MVGIVQVLVAVMVFKVQELIPALAVIKPLLLALMFGLAVQLYNFFARPPGPGFRLWRTPFLFWTLFSLGLVATIPLSLHPGGTVEFLVMRYLAIVLLVLMISRNLDDVFSLEKTTRSVILSALALGCAMVVMPEVIQVPDEPTRYTVGGTYDPNDLAVLMAMSLPFCIHWFSRGGIFFKILATCAGLLAIYAILKTGSRGGLLSLGTVMLYTILFNRQIGMFFRGTLIAGILVGGLAATQTTTFQMLLEAAHGQDYNTSSSDGRLQIWKRGIGYAFTRPVTGVGAACFETADGMLSGRRGGKWSTAHNSFIQVVAETGFVTFTLWILLLVSTFRELKRQRILLQEWSDDHEASTCLLLGSTVRCALLTYLVGGFFLSLGYFPMLYLAIAYAIGLGNAADSIAMDLEEEEEDWSNHSPEMAECEMTA